MNASIHTETSPYSGPQLSPAQLQARQVRQALEQAWPALADVPQTLNELAGLGRTHRVRARGRVLNEGLANKGSLWLLLRGKVSMGKRSDKGKWWQSHSLAAGQWLDLSSAWSQSLYPETAIATTAVLAHEFPANEVLRLSREEPVLLGALLASLARCSCEAIAARQALTTKDFPVRLAEWLLEQLQLSDSPDHLLIKELKRDLAAQLGATPETLSRTLRQFQESGLITMQHSEVWIPDAQRLRSFCRAGSAA
ncbi:CRP/FNR family transcriptional regulator [Paucibacter oligotrophus]|uniref:CRP/FNR family transcriptional regulator n=1 Tax=Roseateles oligotrophus TaxID=1769250 RepID=A0A840L830_9BURK|nr:Crp/Fnr family transcriptional regulator [Roseateles oligotrophus]MBB4844226.1 CRP/FNR family transcriptional regulator [Roseateles oligotrophus]